MKRVLKFALLVFCFVLTIGFFNVNDSNANINSTSQLSSVSSSDFFIFVRVQEGARSFIYVYTDGGVYLTKYEEF